jgi:hypothetical protein
MNIGAQVTAVVTAVTKKWAKQRKAEERSNRSRQVYFRETKIPLRDYVFDVLPDAYDLVSDGGTLPSHARQLMYDVRRRIQSLTDQELRDAYFTQSLLPEFCQDNDDAADWNVVYDPRGSFHEPHTKKEIALGTLSVRDYLDEIHGSKTDAADDYDPQLLYPTTGPANRFSSVLFLEKEGFWPLFRAVRLAERYDLAIMSTKGMSNTASRKLIDHVCQDNLPAFILRDCDASGFTIAKTLVTDGFRYRFDHDVNAFDFGLRKAGADKLGLESESFRSRENRQSMASRLKKAGATPDEIQMIAHERRRIELNAFPSRVLVDFIERKLAEHGVKKIVPDNKTLEAAYRRAYAIQLIQSRFEDLKREAEKEAAAQTITASTIRRKVRDKIKKGPATPWDIAVAELAKPKK